MAVEWIYGLLQGLLVIIGWFCKRELTLIKTNQDVTLTEVRSTNGRVTRLEQSVLDHEKLDDARFENMEKWMEARQEYQRQIRG